MRTNNHANREWFSRLIEKISVLIRILANDRQGRLLLGGFLLLSGLFGIFLFTGSGSQGPFDHQTDKSVLETLLEEEPFDEEEEWEDAIEIKETTLIQDVHIEKKTVCPGEDVLIRARAYPEAGNLRYVIGDSLGPVSVMRWREPGEASVLAVARRGADEIDFRTLPVQVLESKSAVCAGRAIVNLNARVSGSENGQVNLEVVAVQGLGKIKQVRWDFGDGNQETNTLVFIRHSYADRKQEEGQSTFLVTANVIDDLGVQATARATVSLINSHYLALQTGNRVMPVAYDRFPGQIDGGFATNARFVNIENEAIVFSEAILRPVTCDLSPGREIKVAANVLLADPSIPPQASKAGAVKIPNHLLPEDTCQVNILFLADGGKEREAKAYVNLEIRVPRIAAGPGQPGAQKVEDPDLLEEIKKARTILARPQVTPEDLETLRKQGKL